MLICSRSLIWSGTRPRDGSGNTTMSDHMNHWATGHRKNFGKPREIQLSLIANGQPFHKRKYIYGRFALGEPYTISRPKKV